MKQILLYKVDTSNQSSETAIKFANDAKKDFLKQLKKSLTPEQFKQVVVIAVPVFQGNVSEVQSLIVVE